MNDNSTQESSDDAAWAAVVTPFSKQQLKDFCQDIERLFRINPFIEFKEWTQLDSTHFRSTGQNQSQSPAFDFSYELSVEQMQNGIRVVYSDGIKTSTTFTFEDHERGSKLVITDDYSGMVQEERQNRLHEVDKSLIKWAENIQSFIVMWQRWSWLPLWRWYMWRIWQPLKPMARRITYMLLWITLVEVALITLGFAIYWAEYT